MSNVTKGLTQAKEIPQFLAAGLVFNLFLTGYYFFMATLYKMVPMAANISVPSIK